MTPTKFFAMGGMQEIGKSMMVIEHDNKIVIIDCGVKFAQDTTPGVEVIIPDYTYLVNNKEKIKGLFITHGHLDHCGAVPYLLKQIDIKTI
jgi:ribonuclease J